MKEKWRQGVHFKYAVLLKEKQEWSDMTEEFFGILMSQQRLSMVLAQTLAPSLPAAPGRPCSPGGPGGPGWPLSPTGPVSPVGP